MPIAVGKTATEGNLVKPVKIKNVNTLLLRNSNFKNLPFRYILHIYEEMERLEQLELRHKSASFHFLNLTKNSCLTNFYRVSFSNVYINSVLSYP